MSGTRETEHLKKLQEGNVASFKWIYNRYHEKVYGYCLKLLHSELVAEEITEDVFVKVWQKKAIIDPALPISHFLFKLTKDFAWNHLKKEARKTRQRVQYDQNRQAEHAPTVESKLILQDYLEIAEAAIQQLPQKRQLVFNLRYKNGLESREIARQLNISESTVRVHLSKATQFLKTYLKSHPEMPFLCFLLAERLY